jgi:hypothetical protein
LDLARVQQVHVGRRIEGAQHSIEREGVDTARPLELLTRHDLEDVTGEDVLARTLDDGAVVRAREVRETLGDQSNVDRGALARRGGDETLRHGITRRLDPEQDLDDRAELFTGALEDGRGFFAFFDDRVDDGGRRVLHVVTDQYRTGEREVDVRPHVPNRLARQTFESSHVVVGHKSDRTAEEIGKVARRVRPVASEDLTNRVEGRERLVATVRALNDGGAVLRRDSPTAIEPDERVATGRFAERGALQQKDRSRTESLVQRHRGLTVELERFRQGHDVESLFDESEKRREVNGFH